MGQMVGDAFPATGRGSLAQARLAEGGGEARGEKSRHGWELSGEPPGQLSKEEPGGRPT